MALNNEQRTTLRAALETAVAEAPTDKIGQLNASVALEKRTDTQIVEWLNRLDPSGKRAFKRAVSSLDLIAVTDLSMLSKIAREEPVKKDLWILMIDKAPIDFTNAWARKHVIDIWSAGDASTILTALTEPVTRAEAMLAAKIVDIDGISVVERSHTGSIGLTELSESLNGKAAK